jgi:hypothetical protein
LNHLSNISPFPPPLATEFCSLLLWVWLFISRILQVPNSACGPK